MNAPLLEIAFSRLRRRWLFRLPLWLGLVAPLGLTLTIGLTQAMANEAGLSNVLAHLGPLGIVTVQRTVPDAASADAFQVEVDSEIRKYAGSVLVREARYVSTGGMSPATLDGIVLNGLDPGTRPSIAWYDELQEHAVLVAGTWPGDTPSGGAWPVAMATSGAALFNARQGDTLCLASGDLRRQTLTCVQITGLWQARNVSDPYWGNGPPYLTLMATRAALFQMLPPTPPLVGAPVLKATSLLGPQASAINFAGAPAVVDSVNRLRGYFQSERGDYFSTGLDRAIDNYLATAAVRALPIELVGALAVAVAMYVVMVSGSLALAGERRTLAVWRGRGWSRAAIWRLLMVENVVLLALAVPAAVLLAAAAADVIGSAQLEQNVRVTPALLGASAPWGLLAVALVCAVLGAVAWRAASSGDVESRRGFEPAKPWWRRGNLDLWVAAGAIAYVLAAGMLHLSVGGYADLALPIAAIVAITVAGLRLLSLPARLAGSPWAGITGRLASIQLGRRPSEQATLALLVAMAVEVGVLAGVYTGTTTTDAADQAAYSAGADVRALIAGPTGPPRIDDALRGLRGVSAEARVFRTEAFPNGGFAGADVLAIEPESLASSLAGRPSAPGHPSPSVLRSLEGTDVGPALPAAASGLAVWVFSTGLDGQLIAHISAAGWSCVCVLGDLGFEGWRHLSVRMGAVRDAVVTGLEARGSGGRRFAGELAFSDLAAQLPDGGEAMLESFAKPHAWWLAATTLGGTATDLTPDKVLSREGVPVSKIEVQLNQGPAYIRPDPGRRPIHAIVTSALLRQLGVGLGRPFLAAVDGVSGIQLVPVATVDWFPTTDPKRTNFVVVARDPLLAQLGHAGDADAWPNELWLTVAGPSAPVSNALRARGDVRIVVDRAEQLAATANDPFQRDLVANLFLAFAAAAILAVAAFGLHFYLFARNRAGDYAILRANGLSNAEVLGELAVAEVCALVVSVPLAVLFGALGAWVLVPQLAVMGVTRPGPPPSLDANFGFIAAGIALLVALCLALGWIASSGAARVSVTEELRAAV